MLIAEYIEERRRRGEIVESSAEVIAKVLRQWHRHAGPPSTWTGPTAERWVHDDRVRPSTRRSRLAKLRPYVRWLVERGVLSSDVTAKVGRVRLPAAQPRDLTVQQVGALLDAAPDARGRLVLLLMVQCGLRVGDVCRARIEDVDVPRRLLSVRAKGGDGEVTHVVPVPVEAWQELVPWLRSSPSAGPLVRSYWDGSALSSNYVSRLVRGWMFAAGVKDLPLDGISAHSLRHTCAQQMVDAGADLRVVQFALGHRTVRSTEIYVRREPPGLREAMEGRRYLDAA